MTNSIPTLNTMFCKFERASKTLLASVAKIEGNQGRFPSQIRVISKDTGREVVFTCLQPGDPKFNPDQYDGECQVYRPDTPLPRVEFLSIGQPYYFD